ncbi:membrane associated rhomboid family serine protease [Rhodococcus sp. OAS809]|uniref:rhomboid family intramembrane serine protease n=1 Tax=Rhodococcus sp. OAS809 TaxID=2663874 RepID=UPI001789DB5A
MTTSGTGGLDAVLIVAVVVASIALMLAWLKDRRILGDLPLSAVVLWLVVAGPSILQALMPGLLDMFRRDPTLIRDGQWWRILTSVFVQDGGLAGTVANLLTLAVVAPPAFRLWGAARGWALFLLGQLLFGLLTTAVFPSTGAGNSGATLALAAAAAGIGVLVRPRMPEIVLTVVIVVGGATLVTVDDAHGFAVLSGALLGAALVTLFPPHSMDARRAGESLRPSAL